jgi:uncharacterized protein with PIN domain
LRRHALAKNLNAALQFKGSDFAHADLPRAL